jgi:hypothetical protein
MIMTEHLRIRRWSTGDIFVESDRSKYDGIMLNAEEQSELLNYLLVFNRNGNKGENRVLKEVKQHLDDVINGELPCGEDDRSLSSYCAIRALIERLEM